MSVPDLYGQMGLFIHPYSDAAETLDFLYKRRPRDLVYSGHASGDYAGTVSVSSGTSTLVGSATTFLSSHVGSVVRMPSTGASRPTGIEGLNPYTSQRTIASVASASSAVLDANATQAFASVGYSISDPIDMDVAMYEVFLRLCEKNIAQVRNLESRTLTEAEASRAMAIAKQGDFRVTARRIAGQGPMYRSRLADSTSRPEVT